MFLRVLLRAVQDFAYLSPIIKEIESESKERDDLEAMVVGKRKKAAEKH